jgi:CBS domain-containing protein
MKVEQIMTRDPACCTPETLLREVARMMVTHDCGEIPLVQNPDEATLVGIVTDRDIVCRLVAQGRNPVDLMASECMSSPVITIGPEASLEECCRLMEDHQIRRLPVVDEAGACCGIVSQADIARHAPKGSTAELVKEVSQDTGAPSR